MPDVTPGSNALADLAPSGVLRVAVNFGNGVMVQGDPDGGPPRGIVPALAAKLAGHLGVPLRIVPYERAGAVSDSVGRGEWDVCFLAVEPARATQISFTAPYVIIEGTYLVPSAAGWTSTNEVDRTGIRVGVNEKSAYDLFLTRTLQEATLVRTPSLKAVAALYTDGEVDVIAGVRQSLDELAYQIPGMSVLPDRFMAIGQASGTLPDRVAGLSYLKEFIEDAKASGFVARVLLETGQHGATVAPLA